MTFKESLADDLTVFIDIDEFGEMSEIDDIKIQAIVIKRTADLKLADIAHKNKAYYIHPDLHATLLIGNYIVVYFKTEDYVKERGRIPKHTEFCRINGVRYKVEESADTAGITRIIATTDSMNTPSPQMARLPSLYDD